MLSSLKNEFLKEDNTILSQTLLKGAEHRLNIKGNKPFRAYSDKLAESSRGLARGMVEGLFFDKKT
jgi:hypothetical protein